jgi:hypothetical protein
MGESEIADNETLHYQSIPQSRHHCEVAAKRFDRTTFVALA